MSEQTKRPVGLPPEQRRRRAQQRRLAVTQVAPGQDAMDLEIGAAFRPSRSLDFSLFFFSTDEASAGRDKYALVLDAAEFADQNGFAAVWIPERHFTQFGGLYPSPSVLGAALAARTKRINVRAGSVVLPLHHPIRVAEEWSVVDNLSNGRVGVSLASGWSPIDFVLSSGHFNERKQVMYESIDVVQRLWGGATVSLPIASGETVEVKLFPRPVQDKLPVWITSSTDPETCVKAGELGANLLTALLNLSVQDVEYHISLYRQALADHGQPPDSGKVTLMLHTFVGPSIDYVRAKVQAPLTNYLRTYVGSFENLAKRYGFPVDPDNLTEDDKQVLATLGFERYFSTSGLFGTPESCLAMVEQCRSIGVDELACLIDFGVDWESTRESLRYLCELKNLVEANGSMT